jgi:hypothetical protein
MPSPDPFDSLARLHPSPEEFEEAYGRALRLGQNDVGLTAEEERAERPAALLARALARMPELSLQLGLLGAYGTEGSGGELVGGPLRAGRSAAAGALRLTVRGLELHARELGYERRSGPGVVLERWARTTSCTPFSASGTKTRRSCGVRTSSIAVRHCAISRRALDRRASARGPRPWRLTGGRPGHG